ncbi:PD-(D/E)XK nuclease-like domain-containing protein [Actinoplanes rectilineatus]|uniref:PD-(D/E)XK nuclease-like domain-containing protein n=1 Tax=Actinoplanes rectilineatus TaxID=113571 RepID=UPI0005F28FB4|nr:PD-(D/E)XK nuclease-like domain-containing protein [Actinoplanes rectilineatus]
MTSTLAGTHITAPGVYDLPEAVYHADPVVGGSLSCSGAKKLLPPSCPALFAYERNHGQPFKKAFDIGSAAHQLVLGAGPELVEFAGTGKNPEAWQKDDDKADVARIRQSGAIPLKPSEYAQVQAMARKLREHPIASALLTPEGGKPEQTLIWQDPETGITLRALVDWMPNRVGNRLILGDYKTAVTANPEDFRRAAYTYGYAMQNAWYLDGIKALGLDDDPDFVFVVQMKTPPYLVSLIRLDEQALRVGAERNTRARRLFARCQESGYWPDYTGLDITEISLPGYAVHQHDNDFHEEPTDD